MLPRLSLTAWPKIVDDIIGASTLYWTDGTTVLSEAGPWPVGKRDAFLSSAGALYTIPWAARTGPQPPSSSDQYLGTINPDANGLLNCHCRPGPVRRWDIWNAWNQEDIEVCVADPQITKIIDMTTGSTWRAISPDSCATIVIGLQSSVNCRYRQAIGSYSRFNDSAWGSIAIGFNQNNIPYTWPDAPPVNPPGTWGQTGADNGNGAAEKAMGLPAGFLFSQTLEAEHTEIAFAGDANVWALYCSGDVTGTGQAIYYRRNMPANGAMRIRFKG